MRWSARSALTGIGPWSLPWSSVASGTVKCSDWGCPTSMSANGRYSSRRARVATNGWAPSPTPSAEVGDYLVNERPKDASTDRVFVTLKGPSRGKGPAPREWKPSS